MYFGIYKDYRTEYYVGEKEAVLDVVAYMEENNITDEFNVYKTIRIDAKEIINPLCEADILQLIKDHTKETYGDLAKDYLVTMGAGAYNHFRFMVNEFKTALVSFFKNYKLEPTWERIMSSYVYKYDTDKKTWKFIEEIKYEKPPIVEPSEPTPIEPEPVEPDTPTDNPSDDNTGGNTENGDSGTTDNDNTSSGDSDTPSDVDNNNSGNSDTSGDTNSGNDDSNNTDNNVADSNTDDNKNGDEP